MCFERISEEMRSGKRFLTGLMIAVVLSSVNIVSATDRTTVSESETLNIHELLFENLNYDGAGGVIENEGTISVEESTFYNNSANDGGAIWNDGIVTEFEGNTFNNNTASQLHVENIENANTTITQYSGLGGAIYTNKDLTVDNSEFTENNAATGGGAIYNNYNIVDSNLTVKNSKFTNNTAKSVIETTTQTTDRNGQPVTNTRTEILGVGGAIDTNGNLFVENSQFDGNLAGSSGGAISSTGRNVNIKNSSFNGNIAQDKYIGGGAIYSINNGTVNIENSTFTSNEAKANGGALYVEGGTTQITDTNFINNKAGKKGGAIAVGNVYAAEDEYSPTTTLNITAKDKDVTFKGNEAAVGKDINLTKSILNLNANEGKNIIFNGGISGKASVININDKAVNPDIVSTGTININNYVSPEDNSSLSVNLKAGTLALTKDNYLNGTDLTLEEGSLLDLANNNVGEMNLNSLTSNNANLKIDMNLASSNQIFDTIKANTATGILNLQNVNITSDFADSTQNEYTASITPDGMELKTPENGINVLTNDYVYTITAKDNNLTVNRHADENGEALKTDGFTVAVNQTDKVGGVDVSLTDYRIYSANSDIKITATNSETGWTGNLGGKSLTVNGNGYTLDGEDNVGFAVNNGQTITFNDTNIKGFAPTQERKAALTINDGGAVNINASNNDISIGSNSNTDVIYLDGTSSKVFLTTENNKSITVNDKISSANSSNELNLNGNGKITFAGIAQKLTLNNNNSNTVHNAYVDGVNYNLNSGMVTFAKDEYLNGQGNKNTLNLNGGTLNLANNSVGTIDLAAININSNSNIMLDADLAQEKMDKITADSATANKDAILNVSEINLLSDATKDKVEINAVDPAITLNENDTLASHIATSVTEVAYSPIYKYGVGYDPTTGNFSFTRGSSQNYNNVNPSVMVGPVAAQLGGYMGMLDTYNNAFNNMDMRMLNPASVRMAQKQANRYAITEEADGVTYKVNETNSGGTWVRPFAAYDSVGLSNGPKVSNMSYGTFIGGDSAIHQFKNGGEGVLSAHVSYLGSHQSFNGNSIYQNGGNLGLTGTYYKGNFFSGLTVNAGASVADASTRYGNEDFPMFMAGVANKTGYNFEFKDGKFIIQPSLLLSYTFVNTFDYTNAAGVSINGDPLHAFQISPNVRFALNTKNNWQPYFTVGMNWNIMNDSEFTANMATLPDLSMKPYVQYGLGIQKTINDNFTAYGQVLLRHGGRNGIAANAGLRYIFGHESKMNENI